LQLARVEMDLQPQMKLRDLGTSFTFSVDRLAGSPVGGVL
jgi:hypothetical protein